MAKRKRRSGKAATGGGKMNITGELQNIGMGAAGAIGGAMISNMIPGIADPKMKAAIPLLGGIVLSLIMGKRTPMMKKIGIGMSIGGALAIVRAVAPNVQLLAGEETPELTYTPQDVQQALITGEITPEQAQVLLEASPEMMGASTEFAGEDDTDAIEYAPADEWDTTNDSF